MRTSVRRLAAAGASVLAVTTAARAAAESGQFNLHVEPGVAFMLDEPQTDRYGIGFGGAVRGDIALVGPLAGQLSLMFLNFTPEDDGSAGRVYAAGAGVRVRPFDDRAGYAGRWRDSGAAKGSLLGNVWLDANANLVRTGDLTRFGYDVGTGVELSVTDAVQLGPYARYAQVVQGDSVRRDDNDALMLVAGVSGSFGFVDRGDYARDRDGDGIVGTTDQCPEQAEDADGFQDADGCPDPDNDADAVPDADDRCPNEPGPAVNHGCPDKDRDGDGLVDRADMCPDEPGKPVNRGCPGADSDGDGLVDRLDKCPDRFGPVVTEGCPEPDTDKDGFPDRLDKCPTQAEVFNGLEDDDGCPDEGEALAVLTDDRIEVRQTVAFNEEKVSFGTARWAVSQESYLMLATVAKILFLHPEITKVVVEGHTDNVGTHEFNLQLSRKRAEAVRKHLIEVNGVEEHRLSSEGYAFDRPIASNDTEEGRARNRRVEFRIAERANQRPK